MSRPVILCVDDEKIVLVGLKNQLRQNFGNQYSIEIAESAEEALEVLEELQEEQVEVPLVICDQIMPAMKGDELLIEINAQYPKTLKILLTGQASVEAVGNAVNRANLYHYIGKPWEEAELTLTVTEAMRRYFQDKKLAEQNEQLQRLYEQAQQEISERKRVEALLAESNRTLEQKVTERTKELTTALDNLKATQNQLIVQEKMASLGMLTSGIAHEIKNPLNFVNSFAQLSIELAQELADLLTEHTEALPEAAREDVVMLLDSLQVNAQSINEEGQRADSIVRSMLLHSRGTAGQTRKTDLNSLVGEATNLAYHSLRAKDVQFNINLKMKFDSSLPLVSVVPQDISRVVLNIANNACYAVNQKRLKATSDFSPLVMAKTKNLDTEVEIRICDNGPGLSPEVKERLFEPFFTTKSPGEGTGLGLSISYDLIVQGHQGTIDVETVVGECAEFIIRLPKSTV